MTSLLYAIALKSLYTVKKLVQAGANISLPAVWRIPRTPLQAAAQAGSEEIIQYFLAEGVSPNESPAIRAGATALQLSAISGNIRIATILLNHGANINAQPALIDGRTAFEGATEHGRIEMMLFLFQHGADLLSNGQEQHRRAVEFAEDNAQHAAKSLADELLAKALSNHDAVFSRMDGSAWGGNDMNDFGSFPH
jgi:ankyrin repeat protein